MNRRGVVHTSDEMLLAEIRQGRREAFDILYARYWAQAYDAAYKRLKDADTTKDVVQEVFIRIWMNRTAVIRSFPNYLHRAVRNRVLKALASCSMSSSFCQRIEEITQQNLSSDGRILDLEQRQICERLLQTLPPRRQAIVRLRYQQEWNTGAIARELNISQKSVQNQLGKAIHQLRHSLARLLFTLLFIAFL